MSNGSDGGSASGYPWVGVEVRHLAALDTVGREGSFRGAAQRLGYVQSAVSQQIATLEGAVGTRLVERSRGQRSVTLTAAGRRLAEHGGDIVARLIGACADLEAIAPDGNAKTLNVAVDRLIAPRILPLLMPMADRLLPELSLAFSEVGEEEKPESLIAGGKLDAVLGELPSSTGRFACEELLRDPIVLLVQADSPLARAQAPPTMQQLVELPLIGPVPRVTAAGGGSELAELTIAFKTASMATAAALVRSGAGVALAPRLAADPADPADASIAVIDLAGMLAARRIGVYRHPYRRVTAAADRFSALAESAVATLAKANPVADAGQPRMARAYDAACVA